MLSSKIVSIPTLTSPFTVENSRKAESQAMNHEFVVVREVYRCLAGIA